MNKEYKKRHDYVIEELNKIDGECKDRWYFLCFSVIRRIH